MQVCQFLTRFNFLINFLDLAAQQTRLRNQIDSRIGEVLAHGKFINGPEVSALEKELCGRTGAQNMIAVSNGTDALLMCLMAHSIGPSDAVFIPSFTFTATAEVVLVAGATPVFVDIDADTFLIDPDDLSHRIQETIARGLNPQAVIAVDLFGLPADYARVSELAQNHDMFVIADAAQSLGSTQGGVPAGRLAPITATSFFPSKPLGCFGDGGAIFTEDDEIAEILRSIRMHGAGQSKYDVVRIGLNARLDTLQAAILLAKLEIFDEELVIREALAKQYDSELGEVVKTPRRIEGTSSAWAQYTILTDNRDYLAAGLKAKGIPTAIYYPKPMHLQPAYMEFGAGAGTLPVSEKTCDQVLSLPIHPYLSEEQIREICSTIKILLDAM
jgi:UDP-2-acetamido-2-deoxy-ribo-hexuluronate aminotransferase